MTNFIEYFTFSVSYVEYDWRDGKKILTENN